METSVVNLSGDVAFSACFLDNDGCAESGILTGDDLVADKVIRQGDLLFGAATTKINFYKGLNDSGQFAFAYELDNGVTGVAIATPVIDGDYNNDGTVDAADCVVWRTTARRPATTRGVPTSAEPPAPVRVPARAPPSRNRQRW
jgi:hypothetical protein